MRQSRIQRLLDEAICQGAVASQEDLARVLYVSVRTIKRDCTSLQEQGISLPTRGKLKGIGRGQTHKAQIVGRWLRGETYERDVAMGATPVAALTYRLPGEGFTNIDADSPSRPRKP